MTITFTPITVNEHHNGALLGTFENSADPNGNYFHYFNEPVHYKIVGNELFLKDGWHFDYEAATFYNNSLGSGWGPYVMDQSNPDFDLRFPVKDTDGDTFDLWAYAMPEFANISESIEITPVPFSSLETGAIVATISTTLPISHKFSISDNSFVILDGDNIKLLDNFYYDIGSSSFSSGSSSFNPNNSTGQIKISSVQVDSQTASETINYEQVFDYSNFLLSIVSEAEESSSLTFTAVTANEHENGALLGSFQDTSETGGVYSFNSSKPDMLKILDNQLYLEDNYHFDFETSNFYRYTDDQSGGFSWVYFGSYVPEELSWRIKYTTESGTEKFVDATIGFEDIAESIEVTPVAFNSLELGATVATVATGLTVSDGLKIGTNTFLTLDGNNLNLTSDYYYNSETGEFNNEIYAYDLASSTGEIRLVSTQGDLETINYYEAFDYSTFLQSAVSLVQHSPLTYYASRDTEVKEKSGLNLVDALLYDEVQVHANDTYYESSLTGLAQGATVITYSFSANNGETPKYVDGYEEAGAQVTALNTEQKEAARLALLEWETVANIKFQEVEESANLVGTIRFAFTDLSSEDTAGFWGWARTPSQSASSGDIWISSEYINETDWQPGTSYNFMSLLHEVGHSLGLAHPFAEEGSGSTGILPTTEDFRNYSLMSYTDPENASTYSISQQYQYLISSTPMVYDIAAIQHLYGAAANNPGDTTFSYAPDQPFVEAIWDSGGNDTLDLRNFLEACTVSLVPGAYTTIVCTDWSMTNNFGIAYGTIIENASGGEGDDIITGNDSSNTLDGGSGNDILTGGAGLDSFRFSANFGSDTVTDFSLAEDTLMFLDESGIEIEASALIESNNEAGDVVLTASNGSNVTLQGITAYGSFASLLNGTVTSKTGLVLDNVIVKGFSSDGNELGSATSDSAGNFSFNTSENVTLTLEKEFTNDRIITVRDALDALKLSIGMAKSDGTTHPFDFIAADMNQDGKVSVRDALEILKYSLNMDASPANWKFVPDDLDTGSLSRSSVTYENNLLVDFADIQSTQNFIGILVGDVNGTL